MQYGSSANRSMFKKIAEEPMSHGWYFSRGLSRLVKVVMEALHPLTYTSILAYVVKLYHYVTWQGVNNDSTAQYAVIIED